MREFTCQAASFDRDSGSAQGLTTGLRPAYAPLPRTSRRPTEDSALSVLGNV